MARTRAAMVIAIALFAAGLVLGAAVHRDWYFRLIPFGVGIAVGAAVAAPRSGN